MCNPWVTHLRMVDGTPEVRQDERTETRETQMMVGLTEMVPFIAIVVFVILLLLPGGGVRDVADETVVPGVSPDVADAVLFRELGEVPGLPLVEAHAGSFTLRRTSRTAWAVVGAIALFPLGLLFLLYAQERYLQVSLSPHPDGCRLRVVGRARRQDVERVSSALQRVLPVEIDTAR